MAEAARARVSSRFHRIERIEAEAREREREREETTRRTRGFLSSLSRRRARAGHVREGGGGRAHRSRRSHGGGSGAVSDRWVRWASGPHWQWVEWGGVVGDG